MISRRVRVVLIGVAALLALLGLVFRTEIRKAWKRNFSAPRENSTGRFWNPEGLASDVEGNLYVGNQNSGKLVMLDRAGKTVMELDTVEGYVDGDGRPDHITRGNCITAIVPRRLVLVGRHNVAEIDLSGGKPRLVRIVGKRGSGPGEMDGPEGLARTANGELYVTDEHNRRINVFDGEGKYLRSLEVPQDPQTVTVLGDRIYVALNKRNYIACYSREGRELFRIGHEAVFPMLCGVGLPAGLLAFVFLFVAKKRRAAAIALGAFLLAVAGGSLADWLHHEAPGQFRMPDFILPSRDGSSLYITDRANARIQVTDLEGRSRLVFGSFGTGPGELRDPKDLAWDGDGNLVVADSDNDRLQVFTPDGKFLREIR